jgi:hypothetical protein
MSAQILGKGRTLAMRRLVLAAIGVSFFVLSGTTFGADVGIANPSAAAAALGGRHATVHPTEPPASNAKTTSTFVDGLYKELMEWTPPPCLSATSDASLRNYRQKISVPRGNPPGRVASPTRYLRWTALEVLLPLDAAPHLRDAPADNGRPARLEPLR